MRPAEATSADRIPALLFTAAVAASGGEALADEEIATDAVAAAADAAKEVDLSSFSSYILYFLPIIFYGIFTVYRTSFNPQAKGTLESPTARVDGKRIPMDENYAPRTIVSRATSPPLFCCSHSRTSSR